MKKYIIVNKNNKSLNLDPYYNVVKTSDCKSLFVGKQAAEFFIEALLEQQQYFGNHKDIDVNDYEIVEYKEDKI